MIRYTLLATLLAGTAWAGAPPPTSGEGAAAAAPTFYFTRQITEADLKGRTLRELSIMRNTIFARAGNPFRKAWLNAYFQAQPWYTRLEKGDASKISTQDWHNAKAIATFEAHIPRDEIAQRAAAVSARVAKGEGDANDEIELRLLSARLGKWQAANKAPVADRSPLEDPTLLDSQLTLEQLDNMSRRDLRILRNMIYARRGYTFKSALLTDYFEGFEWYTPDPKFTNKRLTRLDWRNVKLVKSLEQSLGGPITDWQHMKDDGWFVAA